MVADLTSKKFIDEFYCFRQTVAGKSQNNIRKFPPIGALKDLRRKAEAVPPHFRAASGARPERQIHAGSVFRRRIRFKMLTFRADIMRRQRINFRNAQEKHHKGRAHQAAITDDIAL